MTVLMVGLSLSILEKLKKDSDYEIIVMDSWEQYNNYSFDKKKYQIIQETYIADITNPNYYLPVLNEIKEKYIIDGVIPSRDYAVRTAAIIAEKLGKKGIGFEKAKILTNKYFLRKACEEYSIPHPRFRQIDSEKEIAEFIKDKPLILKPTRLQASIGISRIETKEDISDAWERTSSAREESAKEIEFGQEKEYVVEEYVGGQEYSVEALVDDGKIVFINITEKEIFEDSFVEKGHIVPANIDERLIEQFENEETNLVSKIGITNGIIPFVFNNISLSSTTLGIMQKFPALKKGLTILIIRIETAKNPSPYLLTRHKHPLDKTRIPRIISDTMIIFLGLFLSTIAPEKNCTRNITTY